MLNIKNYENWKLSLINIVVLILTLIFGVFADYNNVDSCMYMICIFVSTVFLMLWIVTIILMLKNIVERK